MPIRPPAKSRAARVSAATRCSGPRPAGEASGRLRPTAGSGSHRPVIGAGCRKTIRLRTAFRIFSRRPAPAPPTGVRLPGWPHVAPGPRAGRRPHAGRPPADLQRRDEPAADGRSRQGHGRPVRPARVPRRAAQPRGGAARPRHVLGVLLRPVGRAHRLPRGGVDAVRSGRLRAGPRGRRARFPQRRRRVGDLPHPVRARHRAGEVLPGDGRDPPLAVARSRRRS